LIFDKVGTKFWWDWWNWILIRLGLILIRLGLNFNKVGIDFNKARTNNVMKHVLILSAKVRSNEIYRMSSYGIL
jgi:hypothetical protein